MTAIERLRVFSPCLVLLLCGIASIAAPQVFPGDGERVAVIAPDSDALVIIAAAGGTALAATATGLIAESSDPGFVARLYRSGAWLVLRFDGALGCLNAKIEESDNDRG